MALLGSFTPITPPRQRVRKPNAGDTENISSPAPSPNNPFWGQSSGKSWDPASQPQNVHGGPVRAAPGVTAPGIPTWTPGSGPAQSTNPYDPTHDPNSPQFIIPPVASDEQGISLAAGARDSAIAQALQGLQYAAFDYGDPAIEAQYGTAAPNPNSALAQAALAAQQASEANRDARGKAGSLFSSFSQKDQANISSAHDRANQSAYETFQKALTDYNTAVTNAGNAYGSAILPFQTDERQQAINNLPTPTVNSGSNPTQGTVGSTPTVGGGGGSVRVPNTARGQNQQSQANRNQAKAEQARQRAKAKGRK